MTQRPPDDDAGAGLELRRRGRPAEQQPRLWRAGSTPKRRPTPRPAIPKRSRRSLETPAEILPVPFRAASSGAAASSITTGSRQWRCPACRGLRTQPSQLLRIVQTYRGRFIVSLMLREQAQASAGTSPSRSRRPHASDGQGVTTASCEMRAAGGLQFSEEFSKPPWWTVGLEPATFDLRRTPESWSQGWKVSCISSRLRTRTSLDGQRP